jgi:CubicO group peptidase (beta-lactamase class C family)
MGARRSERRGEDRATTGSNRRRATTLALVAALLGGVAAVPAGAAETAPGMRCATPGGYDDLPRGSAAAAGFDAARLTHAVRQAADSVGGSVVVYRYGCKVAEAYSGGTSMASYQSWSAAKSIVATAAGRAMELGLLSPGDTVGSLVPEADRAHGAITVQQLLEQNSGLHQHLIRDFNFIVDDHVANALTLPFDYEPGTHFTYGQVTVALLAKVVGRAAGMDFQDFLRRELLAPLDIPARELRWSRDIAGNTNGYFGIEMPSRFWGRLGQLWLQQGVWNGRRLLDADWMAGVARSSPTNPCYSYLSWVDAPGCAPSWAPPDGFYMSGLGDQIVWVVPSEQLVVVRFGPMTAGVTDALREGVTRAIRLPRPVPTRGPEKQHDGSATTELFTGVVPSATSPGILNVEDLLAVTQVARHARPSPGPTRARAPQVPTRTLRPGRDGNVVVPIACPAVAQLACSGVVRITGTGDATTLSSARFRLGRGEQGAVTLGSGPLDAAIGARGATLVVRATGEDGIEGATTTRVVDVAPVPRDRRAERQRAARRERAAQRRRVAARKRAAAQRRRAAAAREDAGRRGAAQGRRPASLAAEVARIG